MSLETKSQELKDLLSIYDTRWLLGNLTGLIHAIGFGGAQDQLGQLHSPMRQLYYMAGLLMSTPEVTDGHRHYTNAEWQAIIGKILEIDKEYEQVFAPKAGELVDEEWLRIRLVAVPSFLTYFNQGPLNFEEQPINWIRDLYPAMNKAIQKALGVTTEDLLQFYDNLDNLHQANFRSCSDPKYPVRPDWKSYTQVRLVNTAPAFLKGMYDSEKDQAFFHFMSDTGMPCRFFPKELAVNGLTIEKINAILGHLSGARGQTDFLYYTSDRPGNPLLERPIVNLGDGMWQVFEVKQVTHAMESLLEETCVAGDKQHYIDRKGKLLESCVADLFRSFLGPSAQIIQGYFVDGNEQDIIILWDKYAFIIEAKAFVLREPMRDPSKGFVRIKDDFKSSIGKGYEQCYRIEKKFFDGAPLVITDDKGKILETIDTTQYDEAFSIVVNQRSFGQVQTDLSSLLQRADHEAPYPWAVTLDDLEVFLLTAAAKKMGPWDLVDFLIMRELLHGKVITSDECQITGAYLTGDLTSDAAEKEPIIPMHPDLANIYDEVYRKGMGFRDERLWMEKTSGKFMMI